MTDPGAGHLTTAVLADFLEGALTPAQRSEASDHLAGCDACRAALTDAALTLRDHRRSRTGITATGLVAVAAGISALFLVPAIRGPAGVEVPPVRGEQSGVVATFAAQDPPDGARVPAGRVVFRWASAGAGARYHLTVTDERGDVVWNASTRERTVTGPDDAFEPGAVYYWYVDALLDGGRAARTAVSEFRTQP